MLALLVYGFYVLSTQGTLGLLISIAIALITAAFVDRIEYITIGVLVIGLTYIMAVRRYNCKFEGFGSDQNDREEILALNNSLAKCIPLKKRQKKVVKGTLDTLYGSSMEGFADAPSAVQDEEEEEEATTSSAPAPTTEPPVSQTDQDAAAAMAQLQQLQQQLQQSQQSQQSPATTAVPVVSPGTTNAATNVDTAITAPAVKQGFTDEENSGLFKLGQLPSETKSGPFVDVASTMSKAMGALKPDQMAAMTAESKSLLETQKNLMGMLESMRPVLQDGRQLLDTFGSIFGGMGGMGMGDLKI
jgi:hypothetical protein